MVLLPAVQLVYGRALGLLPAVVCSIQHGLQMLVKVFRKEGTTKKGKRELVLPHDGPSPRVELPCTYLMAWFAMHCPTLIKPGKEPPEDARIALLHRFKESKWVQNYVAGI